MKAKNNGKKTQSNKSWKEPPRKPIHSKGLTKIFHWNNNNKNTHPSSLTKSLSSLLCVVLLAGRTRRKDVWFFALWQNKLLCHVFDTTLIPLYINWPVNELLYGMDSGFYSNRPTDRTIYYPTLHIAVYVVRSSSYMYIVWCCCSCHSENPYGMETEYLYAFECMCESENGWRFSSVQTRNGTHWWYGCRIHPEYFNKWCCKAERSECVSGQYIMAMGIQFEAKMVFVF